MKSIKLRFWDVHTKEMYEVGDIQFRVKHGMTSTDLADYVISSMIMRDILMIM